MFTVVLDANVLYGQYLRSSLVYVALTKVAVFRWTHRSSAVEYAVYVKGTSAHNG